MSLFPRPRIRDMTSERLDLEKTSAIDTNYTKTDEWNEGNKVKTGLLL